MKLNMKRVSKNVTVDIRKTDNGGFYGTTGEKLGPMVIGNTEAEVRLKMENALRSYSAVTSLINAINIIHAGPAKKKASPSGEIVHYVLA